LVDFKLGNDYHKIYTESHVWKFVDPVGTISSLGVQGLDIRSLLLNFRESFVDEVKIKGNMFLTKGVAFIWNCLISNACYPPFDQQNAHVAVGDSNEPENPEHISLLGLKRHYQRVDYGYPMILGKEIVFRGTIGPNDANFEWNEWGVANGNTPEAVHLNRRVARKDTEPKEYFGIKPNGATWILQIKLKIS